MENVEVNGTLVSLMQANTATIKRERANQVLANVHNTFKQKLDSSWSKINELTIKQTDLMHSLVPKTSINTAFDVNAVEFTDKDVAITKELANEQLWLEALKKRYQELFGKAYVEPETFFQ